MSRTSAQLFLGASLMLVSACNSAPAPVPAPTTTPAAPQMSQVERGHYLVIGSSCNDCHTPFKMGPTGPEPDMDRMLSGHPESIKITAPPKLSGDWAFAGSTTNTAWAGPWGISYTANLTPDVNTGLGNWTEEMFIKALRQGKHMGTSRPILPPMPWPFIGQYSDDDLKAIFAYLKSIKPISNHVPDPVINEPPPAAAMKKG